MTDLFDDIKVIDIEIRDVKKILMSHYEININSMIEYVEICDYLIMCNFDGKVYRFYCYDHHGTEIALHCQIDKFISELSEYDAIKVIFDYADTNYNFDTSFVEKMESVLESRGYLTHGQRNALYNIITRFKMYSVHSDDVKYCLKQCIKNDTDYDEEYEILKINNFVK